MKSTLALLVIAALMMTLPSMAQEAPKPSDEKPTAAAQQIPVDEIIQLKLENAELAIQNKGNEIKLLQAQVDRMLEAWMTGKGLKAEEWQFSRSKEGKLVLTKLPAKGGK